MPDVLRISPMTRIEGHLDIEVTLDEINGDLEVIDARCGGTMFRGFETILIGRDPRDATHLTQRICGVCPVSHGLAASLALEAALGVQPTDNGRVLRNLVLGANFIQSHLLHFYHLTAPDYVDTTGLLDVAPWVPRHAAPDMITGQPAATLVDHYLQALTMRRKTHQMGAIFGGRLPAASNLVPGGASSTFSADDVSDFAVLLAEIRQFIDNVLIPDVRTIAGRFTAFTQLGEGPGNLLAYGVFDLNAAGTSKLLARGRYTHGNYAGVDPAEIREYVTRSWYSDDCDDLHPANGMTEPDPAKPDAYSFIKAPRYAGIVHETGPLARMWVNDDYRNGISAIHRVEARALETKKIADAMADWLAELDPAADVYTHAETPEIATGAGLTEAPRGALGHWLEITGHTISRYQIVTPTAWNASPADDQDRHGAMEQALIGTPVNDAENPVELLRIVHSFDPCLACSVHAVRPGQRARKLAAIT